MKIAYLILAHNKPQQLGQLVQALPAEAPIFVHFDQRASEALFEEAQEAVHRANPAAIFIRRYRCWWGAAGIMWATLELVSALIRSGAQFDYATLLSGQDYPIKSHDVIARDLRRGGEFIESFNMLRLNRWSGQGRKFGAPDRALGRFVRVHSRVWRVGSRKMFGDMIPFGGSQWWTLSNEAIRYVSDVQTNNPKLVQFLARSFIPDELFMQTILSNSPFAERIRQDDLRFAVWDRPEPPYPAVLARSDLPLIACSDKHFARKFDFDRDPPLETEIQKLWQ